MGTVAGPLLADYHQVLLCDAQSWPDAPIFWPEPVLRARLNVAPGILAWGATTIATGGVAVTGAVGPVQAFGLAGLAAGAAVHAWRRQDHCSRASRLMCMCWGLAPCGRQMDCAASLAVKPWLHDPVALKARPANAVACHAGAPL